MNKLRAVELKHFLTKIPDDAGVRIGEEIEVLNDNGHIAHKTFRSHHPDTTLKFENNVLHITFTNYWSQDRLDALLEAGQK